LPHAVFDSASDSRSVEPSGDRDDQDHDHDHDHDASGTAQQRTSMKLSLAWRTGRWADASP